MTMQILVLPYAEITYGGDSFAGRRDGDAGIDLRAAQGHSMRQGECHAFPLGVKVAIPSNAVGWLSGRSSMMSERGLVFNQGVIDSGYRGELKAIAHATRDVTIYQGERICQLIAVLVIPPATLSDKLESTTGWLRVESLAETERGEDGLGSTGRM